MTLNRRMTVTVAVACVLASTALYPLFKGGSQWFYAGTGAVIVVAICGALSRLRTLPVVACLTISVLGLLLYLNVVFEARHSLFRVIPTPTSVARLWELAGTGLANVGIYAPPAPDRPDLVLLAAGGIGLVAVLADLIGVRLRSAALAGLPLLVLFTVPVTMRAPSGVGTVIVFGLGTAGYLAMLSADGRERIRVWGRLVSLWRYGQDDANRGGAGASRVPWAAEADPGPDTRPLAAAGRRVGLASVVLALCVPLIVPGLHPSKLFSSGPGIGGTGGTAPALALPGTLSQTLKEAQENHPTKVLTYTITPADADPAYLQQVIYDNLTDSGWQASDYESGATEATTLQAAQGLVDATSEPQVTISVKVYDGAALTGSSAPTFLPVPYPPVRVTTPPGVWLNNSELMVFSQAYSVPVTNYTVTSYQVDPSIPQLNAAGPAPSYLASDVDLPSSYKDDVALKQIAEQVTKGKTTEYEKVKALASWLASAPFTYSATASGFNSAAGLLAFLTTGKSGVCVQYAWAMTVLVRLLGIPARLAGGFTEGTPTSPGHYLVKSNDAHAWPEVYFSGFGWIQFEPTPGGGDGTARAPSYQGQTSGSGNSHNLVIPAQPSVSPSGGSHDIGLPGTHRVTGLGDASAVAAAGSSGTPWSAIALAVIAAIALACGLITIVAPPAQRAMSAHHAEGGRRRRPVSLTTAALVAAVAAIVGLTLYRLVSHSSGLDLSAGWATVGIAFGAACAVVLVAPSLIRIGLRRWRWMAAGDDASRAHTAWHEFRNDLADFGVGGRPSEPPRTLADRVTAGLPRRAGDAIRTLALAEERATYAARPLPSASLRRDGTAARRGLAASVRRGARWRARIFPASVLSTLADGMAAIPDHVAALLSRRWITRRSAS